MGIPSFYRHLCKRFPQLITHSVKPTDWLCLDFNCAMYFKLHGMPAYEGSTIGKERWEVTLRKEICNYLEEIISVAKPTGGIYVSCDGVVCAAKRRQQRLRRFKGPWMTAAEDKIRRNEPKERWDQNALTPGTAFMSKLGRDLIQVGTRLQIDLGIPIVVSTTAEPGEGEHKLMAHMRGLPNGTSCTIYGLDADLILLAMLLSTEKKSEVFLFREAQEFEKSAGNEWRTVHIQGLMESLFKPTASKVNDFVAAMSLLGNDFLPKSLTHTVRDNGIPHLIELLELHAWSAEKSLIVNGAFDKMILLKIVEALAAEEEKNLVSTCIDAMRQRNRRYHTEVEEWTAAPSRWATILQLFDFKTRGLLPGWRTTYNSWRSHEGCYLTGLAWTFDYYKGRPVDLGWAYEPHLPPLWSDLAIQLRTESISPPPILYGSYLPDWIHLLAVLPASSMKLLKVQQRSLVHSHPLFWPTQFALFDVGATQLWQCEVVIPIIPEEILRELDKK